MRFKRMTEIYSRMVDHTITSTNKINDFSVGSAIRSIYESVSIELEQFYIMTKENMHEAIDRGVYSSFGFTRKEAVRAYGVVQLTLYNTSQEARTIPRGSRFTSNDPSYPQVYETLRDFVIPRGSIKADVEVFCTVRGEYGNVPQGVINVMNTSLANVQDVQNISDIQTGQDQEPLDELKSRFRAYIESLSKATVPALDYGTREVDEVSGVYIHEQTGLVTIYAHDRNGNLPDHVKKKIEANIEDYRPAGIPTVVKAVTRRDVDLDIEVTLTNKTAITNRFRDEIEKRVTRYLNSMRTSEHLILTVLIRVIMNIDKQLIYDVEIKNLDGNEILEGYEIVRAGEVEVELK